MRCDKCNFEAPVGAKFCPKCRNKIGATGGVHAAQVDEDIAPVVAVAPSARAKKAVLGGAAANGKEDLLLDDPGQDNKQGLKKLAALVLAAAAVLGLIIWMFASKSARE